MQKTLAWGVVFRYELGQRPDRDQGGRFGGGVDDGGSGKEAAAKGSKAAHDGRMRTSKERDQEESDLYNELTGIEEEIRQNDGLDEASLKKDDQLRADRDHVHASLKAIRDERKAELPTPPPPKAAGGPVFHPVTVPHVPGKGASDLPGYLKAANRRGAAEIAGKKIKKLGGLSFGPRLRG